MPWINVGCAHVWEATPTARFQDVLIIVGKKTVPFKICFLPRAAISRRVNSSLREDFHYYTSLPPTADFFPSTPKMVAVGFCQMLLNLCRTGHVTSWKTLIFTAVFGIFRVVEWLLLVRGSATTWRRQGGRFLRWSASYL